MSGAKKARVARGARKKARVLKKLVTQVHGQHRAAVRIQQAAQELTEDGYPPGHPLRTLCLLLSGDAGRAQYVHEQTSAMLRRRKMPGPT